MLSNILSLGLFDVSSFSDLGFVSSAREWLSKCYFALLSASGVCCCCCCFWGTKEEIWVVPVKMILILILPLRSLSSVKRGETPQKKLTWVRGQQEENEVLWGFPAVPSKEVSPERSRPGMWVNGWILHTPEKRTAEWGEPWGVPPLRRDGIRDLPGWHAEGNYEVSVRKDDQEGVEGGHGHHGTQCSEKRL